MEDLFQHSRHHITELELREEKAYVNGLQANWASI